MLKISAEFPDRRAKAFKAFLEKARQIPGYYEKRDARGRVSHAIDFTERTYAKILDGFGDLLQNTWGGTFYVNGAPLRLTHLWQRYLRSADVMDAACCPECKTPLSRLPINVIFIMKPGPRITVEHVIRCTCGADITRLYGTAHAIYTAKTPTELVRKARE